MVDLLELNGSDNHCKRVLAFSGIDIIESAERSGVATDIEVHDVSLLCHIIIPFELKVNGCSGSESKDRAWNADSHLVPFLEILDFSGFLPYP